MGTSRVTQDPIPLFLVTLVTLHFQVFDFIEQSKSNKSNSRVKMASRVTRVTRETRVIPKKDRYPLTILNNTNYLIPQLVKYIRANKNGVPDSESSGGIGRVNFKQYGFFEGLF